MPKNKQVSLLLTKYDIAVMLFNTTLQDIVQSEIKIVYWGIREGMAKPSTPEKKDAIAKGIMYKRKLVEDTILLEAVKKGMARYESKNK